MAQGIAEEIFRLKADTDSIIKGLQQVKGVYKELTEEQVKQVAELTLLEQKEKELLAARNKSANPSTIIKYNKELNDTVKQIGALKEATDRLGASNIKVKNEIEAVSIATKNAFNGTQVNAVKNAASQFNALGNSVNQISRELPAFAVSANVGFLAISNNLPIFFDALEKVKKENAALAAQGQKTTSVMSQLGGALFSVSSLLSIGVTLLTLYGAKLIEGAANLFKSSDALNLNTEAMELNNKAIENSIKNQEDLIALREKNYVQTLNDTKKITDVEKQFIEAIEDFDKRKIAIEKRRKEDNIAIAEAQLRAGDKEVEIVRKVEGEKLRLLNKSTGESIKLNKDGTAIVLNTVRSYGEENVSLNEKLVAKNIDLRTKQYERELRDLELFYDSTVKAISSGEAKARAKKLKPEKTVDLSDRIRQLQIDDIKVEQERERQQAEFDTKRAIRDLAGIKASAKQKKELEIGLKNDLINKLEAIDKKYRDKQDQDRRESAQETADALNAITEDNATTEIFLLEKKISKLKAQNKKANEDEIRALKVQVYEKKKILLDLQESEAIANLKQNEDGKTNEAERFQIETEYANKRKKLEFDLLDSVTEKTKKSNKDRMQDNVKYFADLLKALIDATQQMLAIKIKETDTLIANQERRVESAKGIADRGNAELLELEQKRLDDLNKQREKYVRQQQGLAAIELVANTAIAVSKAAAQGGVAAGVTIAAALIALIAGLASARSIASQAAYYEGGYTGDGNPRDESTAVGKRPYIYHKAEFVMDHKKTRQFRAIFEDIHGGKIDLKEWKQKVQMFDSMGGMAFNTSNPYTMNPQINNIIELKSLEGKLDNLNHSFQSLRLGLNVDEDGFTTFVSKRIERNNFIKNLAKP
jgi:hypothetical protein